jgi:peptidyl-prolyl cis-trans isomerase C
VRSVIESQVHTPSPDEAICRRYYQVNLARFRSTDIFECAHILIAARRSDAAAYTAARARAEGMLAHLRNHPDDFADLAAAQSDCPSRAHAGNLGQITSGVTTAEFEAAVRSLNPGEISDLVETRYGLHIVRLDRRIVGRQLPFEHVHHQIATYLADRAQRIATAQYIALLASRAQVVGIDLPTPANLRVH